MQGLQRSVATQQGSQASNVAEKANTDLVSRPAIDLNTESLSLFVTRVQPILMNAFASCHTTGKGVHFS